MKRETCDRKANMLVTNETAKEIKNEDKLRTTERRKTGPAYTYETGILDLMLNSKAAVLLDNTTSTCITYRTNHKSPH